MSKKGPLYVLVCYILWGMLPVFWKQLSMVGVLYVLANRILWSLVFTVIILALRGERFASVRAVFRDKREWKLLTAAGFVGGVNWECISGRSAMAISWIPAWPTT